MAHKPPSDAFTRFTSTAPPSSSQPSPNSRFSASFNPNQTSKTTSSNNTSSPQSSQETPAQRVARLRAAHRAQVTESQKLSPVDRLISRGRSFADIAHRFTTYSLLAITGVSTVIAAYGLVSLVSHNRRQKRAWIEREMDRLAEAQRAFLRGEADAEQLHLLEQERAGEEIARKFAEDKKRRKEEGVWGRLKGTFGAFTSQGDMGVVEAGSRTTGQRQQEVRDLSQLVEAKGQEAKEKLLEQGWVGDEVRPVAVQAGPVAGVGLDERGRPVPINKVERVKNTVDQRRRTGEKEIESRTGIVGGPLDVLAGNAVEKASSTGQGWWSWATGAKPSSSSSS